MHGSQTSTTGPRRTIGLHIHLLVLVAAALLPMLLLGILATWKAGEQSRSASLLRLQATATTLAEAVDQGIEGHVLQMQLLWELARRADANESSDSRARLPDVPAQLLDLDDPKARQRLPPAILEHARSPSPVVVTDIFRLDGDALPWVAIAASALDGGGRVALLEPSNELINLAHRQAGADGALFALVDGTGRIAARSRDPERWLGKQVPDWDALLAVGADHGHFRARTQEGGDVVLAFQKLRSAPGWALVVGEPREGASRQDGSRHCAES